MVRASVLLCAFLLDAVVGDPHWLPHPVRWMGREIEVLERVLRRRFPATPEGEKTGGTLMAALVLSTFGICTVILLYTLKRWCGPLWWCVSVVLCCYLLAAKSLTAESGKVFSALQRGTLEEARAAVAMIVGRDTAGLDAAGVTRAAVETVAENTSDGVVAPLFYMALFGPVGGVLYKAVNTMDSMVGYHNERYEYWGKCAARLDDAVNWLPARLSGVLMCAAAALMGEDAAGAWRIFHRDRLCHKSPNSAHTEAACAGALGVELGGANYYFGILVEKPAIGDPLRPIEPEDIRRANRLMYGTGVLALALCVLFDFLLIG